MDFSPVAKEPKTRPCAQRQAVRCCRSAALIPRFFACGERTKNTPLYPKTSRALLPQRSVFFNACTFVQAQVRH